MGSNVLQPSASRWIAIITLLIAGLISACGLSSDREKAVANANTAIEDVDRSGSRIADAIATLSASSTGPRDLSPVRDAGESYLSSVEDLNGALRALGATSPKLQGHIQDTFLSAAEAAANDCQRALELLRGDDVDDERLRSSITLLGRCIDRYAAAVADVSKEYSSVSE